MPNPETAPATGCDTDDPAAEADNHYRLGHACLQRQDVDGALAAFHRALDGDHGHHDARFAIAYILNATGAHADAKSLFEDLVAARPDHADAAYQLGKACQGLGDLDGAVARFRQAMALEPGHVEAMRDLGAVLSAGGHCNEAHGLLQRALALAPGDPETQAFLGALLTETGQYDTALPHLAAVHAAVGSAATGVNHASALINAGHFDEAAVVARTVVDSEPDFAAGWFTLGVALLRAGETKPAIAAFETAAGLGADETACQSHIAECWAALSQHGRALEIYERLHAGRPDDTTITRSLAATLETLGRSDAALAHFEDIARRKPDDAGSWNDMAYALDQLGRSGDAVAKAEKALALDPTHVRSLLIAANCLLKLRRQDAALPYLERALAHVGDDTERLFLIGELSESLKRTEQAADIYAKIIDLDPDYPRAMSRLLDVSLSLCDWSRYDEFIAGQIERAEDEIAAGGAFSFDVFNLQALPVSYEFIGRAARVAARTVAAKERDIAEPYAHAARAASATGGRIRLGYLLPYTNYHSLPIVLNEIVTHHDRGRFEVVGFSTKKCDGSDFSRDYRNTFDRFLDLPASSPVEAARLIHEAGIDVLIDVAGLTGQNCMPILAHRPAPVQAHYLGYSITTGADYVDYLITDRIYIPPEWGPYCSEQLVYLPDTFMATLREDAAAIALKRGHFGLPDGVVVFANFNHPCKFEPKIFGAWMRILTAVPDSVMWFGSWNTATQTNLRREAVKRGIDPDRLIFSDIVDRPVHLARLALADLALDNFYHGGGITTVDALWAGLPVLTIRGDTPGARLGATLSTAAGLPEAVVDDLDAYEATAIALANDPARLEAWKERLLAGRDMAPLFDTARYRRGLEDAIAAMWRTFEAGAEPQPIDIAAQS